MTDFPLSNSYAGPTIFALRVSEGWMLDFVFIAGGVGFFLLTIGYAVLCDHL